MKQSQQLKQIKDHVDQFVDIDNKLKSMKFELSQLPLGSYPDFADRMEDLLDRKEKVAISTMYMLAGYFGE